MFRVQWYVNLDEYHHLIQFILASENLYCIFHITFMYHILYFSLRTFTLQFPCFAFVTIDDARKQTLSIKRFNFAFIKDLPSVSQSNVQAVTAETEVQYTLSNIIYFKFQNCCFFSFRSILKEVLLRCTQAKYSMEFIFSANLQGEGLQPCRKYAPLQKFSKIFAQIWYYL